jgi:predicted TPR repeat methyltransferase
MASPSDPRYPAALALDGEGRGEEAASLLRALLADHPDHVDALALLGTVEAQAERFDAALPLLERATLLRPGSAAVLNNLGNVLAGLGRGDEALACLDRSLALRPDHPRTLNNRARVLRDLGREDEARSASDRVVELEPKDSNAWASHASLLVDRAMKSGARADIDAAIAAFRTAREHAVDPTSIDYALASLGAIEVPATAPRNYIERLFDNYAPRFDTHLRDQLGYRTPELLATALLACPGSWPADIVDLGCGTGLCGPLVRSVARRLTGVDLSEGMLEEARKRGCYDELERAELTEHLDTRPQCYDAAIAADVLVYIGDLQPLVAAARRALRPGGLLAVSVERHDDEGFVLQPSRRYAHSATYLRGVAAGNGFEVATMRDCVLRMEVGEPVEGTLAVLRRSA